MRLGNWDRYGAGFLVGIFVGLGLMLYPYGAARQREIALRLELRSQWLVDYDFIEGNVYDLGTDTAAFALCRRVTNDLDASNLYEWARDRLIEARKDEELTLETGKPLVSRKLFVHHMGEVIVTGEHAHFAIMVRMPPRDGEGILEYAVRCAEEMERRRLADL